MVVKLRAVFGSRRAAAAAGGRGGSCGAAFASDGGGYVTGSLNRPSSVSPRL